MVKNYTAKELSKSAQLWGKTKLQSSGLTLEDAKKLKIDILNKQQTAKLHRSFKSLASLKINYCGPDGKPLSDWPQSPPFYRLRYLEESKDFSGAKEKPLRYVQEPMTAPVAYYPQNCDNWDEVCNNPKESLIITEGELKAAKACKEGFPTIGLGGVWNWKSHKYGIEWLSSLDYVNWVKKKVYICFDSDYKSNQAVCSALKAFAHELERRGAFAYLVSLPSLPSLDKVGLDDFLTYHGTDAEEEFTALLQESSSLGIAKTLFEFNDKYVYIRNPGIIVDMNDFENKVSPSAFKEHLECSESYTLTSLNSKGELVKKSVSASAHWIKWPLRSEANRISYIPGKPTFINGEFNSWHGWGVEPKKGDISPFLQLVDHIFTGAEPEAEEWFLKWCAYPLQYPGTKMFSAVVIHGVRHGTGKSLIGYSLGKIYGDNFTELNQMDLHNNHNEWADSKQFAMGDDVTGSNKRADADYLKKIITQKQIRLNPKHVRSYVIPDCINYMFTSQHPDSFFLEDDDRRFFIHEVLVGPMEDDFYMEYELWLDSGGASALFDYMLNLDIGMFNPKARAYSTSAKERMINVGRSDLGSWVRQLMTTPDQVLRVNDIIGDKDLYTTQELLSFYDPTGKTGTTANGLGRELSRAGMRQVYDGKPIKVKDGSQSRYYIVRNEEKWLGESRAYVKEYLDKFVIKTDKSRTKKY